MNLLDMRTVILGYIISNGICAVVIGSLWLQGRRRFAGLGLWLADFGMQFVALLLIALRGMVPDFLSATVSNTMIIGGTILLYMGLEQFLGKPSKQIHNVILLAAFIFIHSYFLLVSPRLDVRTIIFSLGLLVICSQCAWLLLRRVDVELRSYTRIPGFVFFAYCLVSVVRIFIDLIVPSDNDFFHSNSYDTLLVMTYQMLFIILALGLFLMVNRRLLVDLEYDIAKRQQVEEELRLSEEKFFKAFHSSPDAILLTRLSDGKLVEVNDGFARLTGYSREETLNSSSINLGIWANPRDREECIATLVQKHRIRDQEYEFRKKSGKSLYGLYSGEIVYLGDEAHILSIVRDITEQKWAEATIANLAKFPDENPNPILRISGNGTIVYANTPASLLLQSLNSAVGLPAPASWQVWVAQTLASQRHQTIEMEHAGIVYACEVVPIQEGGYVNLYVHDITERKQVEEIMQLRLKLFEFAATHSLNDLMQNALDEIGRITNSPIGFYHFVEPDQKTLSLQAWSTRTLKEFCRAEGKGMHYNVDQAGVWVDCVHQRKPVIHNNYAALPHRKGLPDGHAEVVREVVVPILRDGRIVSILGVGNKPSDYDEKDIELVSYIADVVWGVVERKRAEEEIQLLHAELREQAIRDPLTGLYNRRYLNETLGRELAHADREKYPISFVVIDIDHFKDVNDKFGHDAGDAILQKLSTQLMSQTRYGDIVCRYGGEEFLAVLLNVTVEVAFQITERWRLSFLGSTLLLDHNGAKATISCGISEFPMHGRTEKELIVMADKAMYQAKAAGRNRVVIWQSELKE